jgi:hypothetical protein
MNIYTSSSICEEFRLLEYKTPVRTS